MKILTFVGCVLSLHWLSTLHYKMLFSYVFIFIFVVGELMFFLFFCLQCYGFVLFCFFFWLAQVRSYSQNMSRYQGDEEEIYYVADDYELAEVDDDTYFQARFMGDSESDEDDYDHLVCELHTSVFYALWHLHEAEHLHSRFMYICCCSGLSSEGAY